MQAPVFTPPGAPLLQMIAAKIPEDEILSDETQAIIERMFEVASGERDESGEKRGLVGLAAPQIGIGKRIILVDMGVDSEGKKFGSLEAFINPEITWVSPEMAERREGCFSVDSRVMGIVQRAGVIHVKAIDRRGVPIEAEYSGMTARIFQHEIDHLDGIRFPDRVGSEGRLHWVEEDEYPEYKKDPNAWSCQCPWSLWLAMKKGEPYSPPK